MNEALLKKLTLKPGKRVLLLNVPSELEVEFEGLEADAAVAAPGSYGFGLAFAEQAEDLPPLAEALHKGLEAGGLFWVAYPKKSGKIKSNLTRDEGWEPVSALGYLGVRQVAIDANWSALRFKQGQEIKTLNRGKEWPGVDPVKKTVTLPEDFQAALDANPQATAAWENYRYSHKREWAIHILEAKKPETRANRIAKAVEKIAVGKTRS